MAETTGTIPRLQAWCSQLVHDAVRTTIVLLKITIPISILTKLLKEAGVTDQLGHSACSPDGAFGVARQYGAGLGNGDADQSLYRHDCVCLICTGCESDCCPGDSSVYADAGGARTAGGSEHRPVSRPTDAGYGCGAYRRGTADRWLSSPDISAWQFSAAP